MQITSEVEEPQHSANKLLSMEDNILSQIECHFVDTPKEPVQEAPVIEINALEYNFRGKNVVAYPAQPRNIQNKLPYVALTCILSKNCKANIFALYDSGCSTSLISQTFVQKFPQVLKDDIEPLDLALGVATVQGETRITGRITLMLSLKTHTNDEFPLIFLHQFYIASHLNKDMYFGADFILNYKIVENTNSNGFFIAYPENYAFTPDPNDFTGTKFIPFFFMNVHEAAATNNEALILRPNETAHIECRVSKPMQGRHVIVKNNIAMSIFASRPDRKDFMPQVAETETIVDDQNNVYITITNRENYNLPIYQNSTIAFVDSNINDNSVDNYATEFLELNEIDTCLKYLSSPTEISNIKHKYEVNWLSFLEEDKTIEGMTKYLEYEPPKKNKQKKSDFTQQEFLNMFNFEGLDQESEDFMRKTVIKHRNAFAHFKMDIRQCNTYVHDIEVIGTPVLPKKRPIQDKVRTQVSEVIDGLVQYGIMSRDSPRVHYSNFVPVMKKDNSVRLCCDLINLNKCIVSKEKIVQMGSPEQLLHRLFEHKYCYSGDFHQAYYHLKVTKRCMRYYGMYDVRTFQSFLGFIRVIQGEKTSVFSYNKMTNINFALFYMYVLFWIDDILIYAKTKSELNEKTAELIAVVDKTGLSLSPEKFNFNRRKIKFLGKEIDKEEGTYQIPQAKIQALLEIKPPINYKGLRSFLGILKYYNSHLPGVGIHAHPLQEILRDQTRKPFKWSSEAQQAFLDVKSSIAKHVTLNFPYENGIYMLYTDASKFTYAMVLYSKPRPPMTGEPKLIAMYSKSFPKESLTWGIYFKELYAVVWAVTHFIEHLFGEEIELYCDNRSLLYCASAKADSILTYRLAMQLSGFNIAFYHCRSKDNRADFVSRTWQSYIDQGIGKETKRSAAEIEREVDKMPLKSYYSPEEVHTLLTYNFKEQIDVKRIAACKQKYKDMIAGLNFENPKFSPGCCKECKIEISNIEYYANSLQYNLPREKDYFSSIDNCVRCRKSLHGQHLTNSSAFSAFVPETRYEKRRKDGHILLQHFRTAPIKKIAHVAENNSVSLLQPVDRQQYNPTDIICSYTEINSTDKDISRAKHPNIHTPDPDFERFEILHNFSYITVDDSNKDYKYVTQCKAECSFGDPLTAIEADNCEYSFSDKEPVDIVQEYEIYKTLSSDLNATISNEHVKAAHKLLQESNCTAVSQENNSENCNSDTTNDHNNERDKENFSVSYYDHLKAQVFKYGIMSIEKFVEAQENDPAIRNIKKKLLSKSQSVQRKASNKYSLYKNVVFRKFQTEVDKLQGTEGLKLYVPEILVPFLLGKYHAPANKPHVPGEIMYFNLREKYYFPNLKELAKDFFNKCRICHYIKKDTAKKQTFGESREVKTPLTHIVIDYLVNMPESKEGYKHVILVMCSMTRYCMLICTKTRNSKELLEAFLKSWVPAFGLPTDVTSDSEKSFISGEFYEYMTKMGIAFHPISAYRACANGKIESCVGRGKDAMTSLALSLGERGEWPLFIDAVTNGLNTRYHHALGMTPHHALFCFDRHDSTLDLLRMDAVTIDDKFPDSLVIKRIDREAVDNFILNKDKQLKAKNSRSLNKNTIERKFQIGQKVMRRVFTHRLAPKVNRVMLGRYCGPYTIKHIDNYRLYLIEDAQISYFKLNGRNKFELLDSENIAEQSKENAIDTENPVPDLTCNNPSFQVQSKIRSINSQGAKIIIDHKAHCKVIQQNLNDLFLPTNAFKDIDSLLPRKHAMTTRSKRQQQ